jgi:hypothetical protein
MLLTISGRRTHISGEVSCRRRIAHQSEEAGWRLWRRFASALLADEL